MDLDLEELHYTEVQQLMLDAEAEGNHEAAKDYQAELDRRAGL